MGIHELNKEGKEASCRTNTNCTEHILSSAVEEEVYQGLRKKEATSTERICSAVENAISPCIATQIVNARIVRRMCRLFKVNRNLQNIHSLGVFKNVRCEAMAVGDKAKDDVIDLIERQMCQKTGEASSCKQANIYKQFQLSAVLFYATFFLTTKLNYFNSIVPVKIPTIICSNDQSANGHSSICISNSNILSNKCYYEQIVSRNCYVAKKGNDRLLLSDFQTVIGEKWMDGHNCGIFVYTVMLMLDKSKPIEKEFDPIRLRINIFDDVIANSDDMINECLFCCNEIADELLKENKRTRSLRRQNGEHSRKNRLFDFDAFLLLLQREPEKVTDMSRIKKISNSDSDFCPHKITTKALAA
ncbi:hypothetical protein HELRODRAFT_176028 [Helobdella robusta]|uniref:Uncharacterized protein n=1 Tax=Helobdella robusta TaxID=6412 RepID=T1FA18_HELRO|nr:hypothetical protein HELRODRAFT_176028 [Helobdella robusta]ESO00194.1 hypothetical protein HELRODRAFT_176028 [Helobdella robusta]